MEVVQAGSPDVPQVPDAAADVGEGVLATTDFVDCYQTHYRRLVRALRLGGADAATAEDLAQEAFARALVHWRRVRKGVNPPGYVYTTGFRLLARSRRQWRRLESTSATGWPGSPAAATSPTSPTEAAALTVLAVEAALAAMPPKRRACAVMCLVVGLPVHQAARALGIADGTVRKHLDEARRDLRLASDV
jgi:RNA polymerase sigma-70 factor (ECF subfamily)